MKKYGVIPWLFGLWMLVAAFQLNAQQKKPNILVIWGDDIGGFNISAYNQGMMGYKTPNIDRIAKEGALFTDWYGQQSCTAGRAAFITGQSPIRTGLTKVGLPGAPEGMKKEDPTIGGLLKPLGYATGQFGKNHLGDRDDMLPTAHGFDEFLGNLYHLNAEEEPENADYPKNPEFIKKYGPRGVIHSWALPDGTQKIEDTGPLTKKRMETVDEGITTAAIAFMDKAAKDGKPFFVWWNSTRMHIFTHLSPSSAGKTGLGIYADGMVEHDAMVGQLLDELNRSWASETTPLSCTPPTTAPRPLPGPTVAPPCSAGKRTPTGKAATACPRSSAGPALSSRAPSSTT
jgi:arylsulfatase